MRIEIRWQKPIALRSLSLSDVAEIHRQLEKEPGIYMFARRWKKSFEPLYVGQATRICTRVKQQLNNRALVEHILNARMGAKFILVGYLAYDGRTNVANALDIAEQAYIRECVSARYDLHNKLGTRLHVDEVISAGDASSRRIFPKTLRVEKS